MFSGIFDIIGMFNMIFIVSLVGAIIFLIIVIIIVYKLLHSNVDNTSKKLKEVHVDPFINPYRKEKSIEEPKLERCLYCGEKIEPHTSFCPICGAELKK